MRHKKSLLIACEGQTEERYFQAVGEHINEDSNYFIKVYIMELEQGIRQDPVGLVKEAHGRRIKEGYDEAWAVFDRDRGNNSKPFLEAFDFAHHNGISIAFSSIAFEHWVLLHYCRSQQPFERSDCESRGDTCTCNGVTCVCAEIKKYYAEYKKGSYKLYNTIKPFSNVAIENAAWLKCQMKKSLDEAKIYEVNPITTVDDLVRKLFDAPKIIFVTKNNKSTVNDYDLCVDSVEKKATNLTVTITLLNKSGVIYIANNTIQALIIDSNGLERGHTTDTTAILSGESGKIELVFNEVGDLSNPLHFSFKLGGDIVMMEL